MTETQSRDRRLMLVVAALLAVLAAGVPLGLWWLSSQSSASFADAEVLEANHLGAATLDIAVGTTDAALGGENLAPGDAVSGQVVVTNDGTLPLRYGVRARTGGSILSSWLVFALWQTTGICDPDGAPADAIASDLRLTSTDTTLSALDAEALTLAPGASAVLCLGASLPLEAPNEVQGQRVVVDLVIDAEHDLEAAS